MKTVAVVLSGCGVFDGSEIHEAVSTLLALDLAGAQYECFAPNVIQSQVVNHLTQAVKSEPRNALEEAARIARGKIKDIKEASVAELDAAIFPGGMGAALTLSDYASMGADMTINEDVLRFATEMKNAGKPQGFICISPMLIAKIYGKDVELTIGNDATAAENVVKMGGKHVVCTVGQIAVDNNHKVVSTPAYMLANRISEVFTGVSELVKAVLCFC